MRLESASVTRVQGLDVLLDAARSLNDGDPLDVVLEQLVRVAARAVWHGPGDPGAASLWRVRGSGLSLEAESGEVHGRAIAELPLSAELRRALEGRRAVRLKASQITASLRSRYDAARPDSIAVVPILSYGRPFGLMTVPLEGEGLETEADLKLLTGVAELGGLAVAAAADFDLELRLAVAFELLPQMITGASGAEDADEAASLIVTRVGEVPGVDRVLLFMRGDLKRGLWIKASTDSVNLLRLEQDDGAVAQAVRERQIVVVNDGQPWRSEQDALIAADNRHILAVPVAVAEEIVRRVERAPPPAPIALCVDQRAGVDVAGLGVADIAIGLEGDVVAAGPGADAPRR